MRCGDVAAKRQQACLDALDQVRTPGPHIQIFPSRKQGIPNRFTILAAIQIELKSSLMRPAGAGDDHVLALKIYRLVSEKFRTYDIVTKHPRDQFISPRALDRQRGDVWLKYLDIEFCRRRKTLAVKQHI